MHKIWANDLPDNCIDDMEAFHLEEEGPSPNFLFFAICCPFQSLKGCQEARGVAKTSQSGESGGRQKSPLAKS